jgi:tRNA modification GTPase
VSDPPIAGTTMAACLTPAGAGAIATLAVRGPHAWETVRRLFRGKKHEQSLPLVPVLGRRWLGTMGPEHGDEVVVAVKDLEPVPWIEIHCHGGTEVVRFLMEALVREGIEAQSWQAFSRNVEQRPFAPDALIALAHAPTLRTAQILLDQYHGAFHAALCEILEAWPRKVNAKQSGVRGQGAVSTGDSLTPGPLPMGTMLEQLASRCPLGRHLTNPWRVAIAGAPNVGKSSLLNALAGYQRAIVSPSPGTTRDLVRIRLAIDGWPVEFTDTAGIREGAGDLEQQGISLACRSIQDADLCLWIVDAGATPIWPQVKDNGPGVRDKGSDLDSGLSPLVPHPSPLMPDNVLLIVNKCDLPPKWDLSLIGESLHISARTGQGIEELCCKISKRLVPLAPPAGAPVPFTSSLCMSIERCQQFFLAGQIEAARAALEQLW